MAKIKELPAEAIIGGFKGTIDYYLHDGIPCVRRWPQSPGKIRSPAVMEQWAAWSYVASAWRDLDPRLRSLYERMSKGSSLTGRDLFTRSYLSGAFFYPTGD